MPTSYQKGVRSVNVPPKPTTPVTQPIHPRDRNRDTATFTPYYWEAYNEIVQPRRFDHYLIRRWLPSLGPTAFAFVKALRDRCYHSPLTGDLRSGVEIDLDEIGEAIGVSRATIVRELRNNAALAHFVRRQAQFRIVEGRPQRDKNMYQVSMDDPVHPDDMQAYDDLRAIKEMERQQQEAGSGKGPIIKGEDGTRRYKDQNEPHSKNDDSEPISYADQNDLHRALYGDQIDPADTTYLQGQNDPADTTYLQGQIDPAISENSPSVLTKGSLTPAADSPHISPQGEGDREAEGKENSPTVLQKAWDECLEKLRSSMTLATFKTHIEMLTPLSLNFPAADETNASVVAEVLLGCPSEFTRTWLEKRHVAAIQDALSAALGAPVSVRLAYAPGGILPATGSTPSAPKGAQTS